MEIERVVAAATGGPSTAVGARRASTGHANTTWFVEAEPTPFVVKVQREPSVVFGRDPAIETDALRILSAHGAPVPPVVASDLIGAAFGAPPEHWLYWRTIVRARRSTAARR